MNKNTENEQKLVYFASKRIKTHKTTNYTKKQFERDRTQINALKTNPT